MPLMKRILKSLTASIGALALFAVIGPSDAAAQHCRSSSSYGYSSGYGRSYTPSYTTQRRYVAPVRRSRGYTSARIVVNPHYGNGSIYYRGTSLLSASRLPCADSNDASLHVKPFTWTWLPSLGQLLNERLFVRWALWKQGARFAF